MTNKPTRGRPATPAAELRHKIDHAAIELLLEKGHEAFSINELAARAGVAKKTIYRFYQHKHQVLDDIFEQWTQHQYHPVLTVVTSEAAALAELERYFTELAHQVLTPLSIGIFKYLQANHPGKQALLTYYQTHGIGRVEHDLNQWFEQLRATQTFAAHSPDQPARYLQSLIIAPLLRDIALGIQPPVPALNVLPKIRQDLKFLRPALFPVG